MSRGQPLAFFVCVRLPLAPYYCCYSSCYLHASNGLTVDYSREVDLMSGISYPLDLVDLPWQGRLIDPVLTLKPFSEISGIPPM